MHTDIPAAGPDVGDANAAPILAFCDENESHAIQIAWASAQLSLLQANLAINLAVFDAFFAPSTFPGPEGMSEFLSNISTQKPLNDGPQPLRPAIVCAKGNIFQEIFPLVPADLASACLDPAKPNRYFTMVGKGSYHAVFLCGSKFFSLPGSVEPAGENNCPAVRGNMFVNEGGFPLAQSMLLVIGMMNLYRNIRMQNSINMWIQLNPALQNRERPRGANVVLFVFSAYFLAATSICDRRTKLMRFTKWPLMAVRAYQT